MRNTSIIITCIFLLVFTDGFAQRFYSINDRYPFAQTQVIYQDDYGFIWFGTKDGLIKYDGYSTKEYRNIPGVSTSLPGAQIKSIVQESDSTLFIGFENIGLVLFSRNTGISTRVDLNGGSSNLHVNSLIKDHKGNIWIGTNQGLYKYEKTEDEHFSIQPIDSSGLVSKNVLGLFEDRNNDLWIGTDEGIHLIARDKEAIESPMTNTGFPKEEVISIQERNTGELWVSFRRGKSKIYRWEAHSRSFIPITRFNRDGEFSFVFDSEDHLWASSHARGIYKFTPENETFFMEKHSSWHGMRAMFTFSIYHDKFDNIWVEGDEVYKMPGHHKEFYSIESDQFQVISVFADEDNIWYCSNEPYKWSRSERQSIPYLENVDFTELINPDRERKHKRIYQYKEWRDFVVFTSIRNVFIWNRKSNTFTEYPTKLEGAFREFFIDSTDQIWFPGDNGNPAILDLNSGKVKNVPNLKGMTTACAVVQSKDGTQWWGTHNHGLFSYDPKSDSVEQFVPDPSNPQSSISSFSINDILVHSDGSIWIGTKLGLNVIDPKTNQITRHDFKDQSINTNINSILEDNEGNLWLGTEKGLLYFNPIQNKLRHFTVHDGLINTNYTPRACYKDQKGCLYFGGNNGVDYFFPEKIGVNTIVPDLYIKNVHVNGKLYNDSIAGELLHSIRLKHKQNFLEVELTGLHYVSPEAQEYAYRISDQSDDWISLGQNRVITLARLSPGNYSLEAKCANSDGFWSDPKELLHIIIQPPFWQTAWFLGLMTLIIMLSVYLIYSGRIRKIRRDENQKTELNKRIAEIEMKAIRAQMNPHFLFNSLNSIRLLIDKGDSESAKLYLIKYSQLIRQVLNNSRNKFIRLDQEINMLRLYLDLEKMRFKNFNYLFSVDDNVDVDFIEIPPLLMQPYVENAIWHGLMHKKNGEKQLDINIVRDKEFVTIKIEDNGIGRKQSEFINSTKKKTKDSFGLKMSEDRIMFLQDIYGREATVQIDDLENPTGTRVIIRLPIGE